MEALAVRSSIQTKCFDHVPNLCTHPSHKPNTMRTRIGRRRRDGCEDVCFMVVSIEGLVMVIVIIRMLSIRTVVSIDLVLLCVDLGGRRIIKRAAMAYHVIATAILFERVAATWTIFDAI